MIPQDAAAARTVAEKISRELDDDYVEIWALPWHLRRLVPNVSDARVHDMAEVILRELTDSGVVIGDLSGESGVFSPWVGPVVERVMREWEQLGRDPNIGEIAWLSRPE